MVYATIGDEKVHGLRWSMNLTDSGKADDCVLPIMERLLESFSSTYANSGYSHWATYLERQSAE